MTDHHPTARCRPPSPRSAPAVHVACIGGGAEQPEAGRSQQPELQNRGRPNHHTDQGAGKHFLLSSGLGCNQTCALEPGLTLFAQVESHSPDMVWTTPLGCRRPRPPPAQPPRRWGRVPPLHRCGAQLRALPSPAQLLLCGATGAASAQPAGGRAFSPCRPPELTCTHQPFIAPPFCCSTCSTARAWLARPASRWPSLPPRSQHS